MSALEALLYDVYHVQSPRPSDYDHRRELVRVFNLMAREVYGNHGEFPVVQPFGSFLMDMFSAESDLDLSINLSNDMVEFPREKKIQTLRKFARRLYSFQSKGHVSCVQPILRARVPILKVVDHGTGIECDISVENKDGILKSQIIHIIAAIDERFQKLSCLMKAWAKAHDINSSKDRTLNSLSITLLVAFHLQTRNPPILPAFRDLFKHGTDPECVMKLVHGFLRYGERNKESLAELFLTLLTKLVSVETLWPEGLCASTYEGCWISKTWDSKVGYINVEDFTDRSQNVARSVGKEGAQKIYKCIHTSLHDLSVFMNGRIQAPNLEGLFFGPKHYSTLKSGAAVDLKRSFPFSDPVMLPPPFDPIPTKKMRFEGVSVGELKPHGWIPWDVASQIQPIHNQHPPVVAQEHGYRSEQVPSGFVRSGGPSHIASVPPPYGGGLQKNMNPMLDNELPYVRHAQEYAYRSERMPSGSVWSGGPLYSPSVPPSYGGLQQSPRFEGFAKYKSQ
ncbi:protein HESO1-like [Macadamia integrifolia]|uniref:protein HESO1-like n=1 Tax=Macadamia integrifolia TaxID=60698 RepID=UPI001C52904B|nr:protein HESO1-like [Macadamia integrifolia]